MTSYVMHREVCLKHRKNRREIFLRVRTRVGSGVCSFCRYSGAGAHSSQPAPLIRGHRPRAKIPERHSGDAGASPADRPTFKYTTRRAPACAARSPKPCGLGAAPRRRATFKLRGRQEARQRPHKPSRAGSIPAPATTFSGPLDHSGGHSPRKRESTVQSRGGPPFQTAGRLRTRGVS